MKLSKILRSPWAVDGSDFSDKVWKNKAKLVNQLDQELSRMAMTGESPKAAIRNIQNALNTSKSSAARLIMTEQAYFTTAAQKDAFGELDVEAYEVVGTLDGKTCEDCGDMDGAHYPVKDMQVGVNAPLFHPYCRCTTVPYFDDEFAEGKRASRDKDGKTIYEVPEGMKSGEWKKQFVGGEKSFAKPVGSGTIKAEGSTIAMARKPAGAVEKSRIIREAVEAPKPVYADDLRRACLNVKPMRECQDIALHGTQFYMEYEHKYIIDSQTLAHIISGRRDYNASNIRLLSCSTGKEDKYGNCVAQEVANMLGVDVYAPTDILNIHPDGRLTVGKSKLSESDGFKWFHPKKGDKTK